MLRQGVVARDFDGAVPRVLVRTETTKSRRADTLAIHPQLAGIEYGSRTIGYADFHALRSTVSTMMAAAEMGQRMRQAHMRHTDPRLTECTYMDESLLPVAEELSRVPAILAPGEPAPEAIPLRATGTDGNAMCVANLQQTYLTSGNCLAFDGNDGGAQIGESGSAQVASAQEESPGLSGLVGKAGERIRTVDIHVGNRRLTLPGIRKRRYRRGLAASRKARLDRHFGPQ